jgi:hypothetical protein
MIGALAGAVVGAFAAWLFSLDLLRRDKGDRAQEREEENLDRLAQREQDRLDRAAEREEERQFRRSQREQDRRETYEAEMLSQWPRVADALMEYANANRAVVDGGATASATEIIDRFRQSVISLMGCLHEVATLARGDDHEIVNNLGVLAAMLPPHQPETIEALDHVRILLSSYITAHPDLRESRKHNLRIKLLELTGLKPRG